MKTIIQRDWERIRPTMKLIGKNILALLIGAIFVINVMYFLFLLSTTLSLNDAPQLFHSIWIVTHFLGFSIITILLFMLFVWIWEHWIGYENENKWKSISITEVNAEKIQANAIYGAKGERKTSFTKSKAQRFWK